MTSPENGDLDPSADEAPVLPSAQQIERLARISSALWAEMETSIAAACERLLEAPELGAMRARLLMLRAALGALEGPFSEFLVARQRYPSDREDEAFRWIGALEQAIEHWMDGIRSDMEDYQPYLEADDETPETGFGVGFMTAWERFKAAYTDWSTAWVLMDNLDRPYADCTSDGSGIDALERRIAGRTASAAD